MLVYVVSNHRQVNVHIVIIVGGLFNYLCYKVLMIKVRVEQGSTENNR